MELTENHTYTENLSLLKSLSLFDWLFGIFLRFGALFELSRYGVLMDIYEKLFCSRQRPPSRG